MTVRRTAKVRNPLGRKVSLGNGYYYQRVTITGAGYVKLWYRDKVIDRATSVAKVREMAKRYAQHSLGV